MLLAMALARGELRTALKCAEHRCRLLGLIGPKVAVVQPVVKIDKATWDAIQGAADAGPPEDSVEERLARESIPALEAKLNGTRRAKDE
jgi:hypothetical protein